MCILFITLSYNEAGMLVLLPLMAIKSMVSISSLNDLYSCSYLVPQFFVNGKVLRCSSSKVTSLISCAVMQSGMSQHDSITLMVMHMPGISSSLFFWLCLDSQFVMNTCSHGLYSILIL